MVYQKTKSTLKKEGLAPKKKLGQNFLVHKHTAQNIVYAANLTHDDTVIEVGVGLGALTGPLAESAGQVIGIEADSGIVAMHKAQGELPENVHLRHEDILKTDLIALERETGSKLKIVANLPYSISSPFIFKLIEHHHAIAYAVVMLQKEVAERLMAKSGTKSYGAPTILLACCADVTPLLTVGPNEFHPRPKVDSLVIKITFSPPSERLQQLPSFDFPLLRRVVNGAFGQRRKTLLNSLSSTFTRIEKTTLAEVIQQAGITPGIRAEKLELSDFIALSESLKASGLD